MLLFPITISVGTPSVWCPLNKILLPHPPYASIFAFVVLPTEASPSLCAQLESTMYAEYMGKGIWVPGTCL